MILKSLYDTDVGYTLGTATAEHKPHPLMGRERQDRQEEGKDE